MTVVRGNATPTEDQVAPTDLVGTPPARRVTQQEHT
jgi:hypothetical protein